MSRRHTVDVLLLDLDDFKTVNDVLGHQAGDALLVEISRRLRDCVGPAATVSRLGGDEFAIVLEDTENPQSVAMDIVAAIAVPMQVDRRQILPSGSVGIAHFDPGGDRVSASELLRRADIAMYAAKTGGKNGCALFQDDMTTGLLARADLEDGLREAVERGEIVVHYQPILDARVRRAQRVRRSPAGDVPAV